MATIIREHLLYKQGMHSRLFQCVIYNDWVYIGKSKSGGGHMEHVVPLVYLLEESNKKFRAGRTVEDVAEFLKKNFKVVAISVEKARRLNSEA